MTTNTTLREILAMHFSLAAPMPRDMYRTDEVYQKAMADWNQLLDTAEQAILAWVQKSYMKARVKS